MDGIFEYKQIKDFPNYFINRNGEVYSKFSNKKLKTHINYKGYEYVTLGNNSSSRRKITIHRLIAIAFIENPQKYPMINHINGIKNDNRIENLEWCNHKQNMIHAHKLKLIKPSNMITVINSNTNEVYESIKQEIEKL